MNAAKSSAKVSADLVVNHFENPFGTKTQYGLTKLRPYLRKARRWIMIYLQALSLTAFSLQVGGGIYI